MTGFQNITYKLEQILINPIGVIHTPFHNVENMPIQPIAAEGIIGYIELLPEYVDGLKDLQGFSHITLVYRFHKIIGYNLEVIPFMDTESRGIFATKAPKRPNAIGISTVKLLEIDRNIIHIEQVDMLNGTPLIDIKPFYPRYDNRENVSIGWLEKNKDLPLEMLRADNRFKQ
jgi:tRNA-Thr(GGU) m(6)t(6)A37 methyltransferase TsaA